MTIPQLSAYTQAFNIFLTSGEKEGILINVIEYGISSNNVKVLMEKDFKYWTQDESTFVRAEHRDW